MSIKTTRGAILLNNEFEDPSSSNPPNIISFTVSIDPETNKFYAYFSVEKNYTSLQLICRFLDDNNQEVTNLTRSIDVYSVDSYLFYKDKNYKTSLELVAINKNGQDSRKLEPIDKASNTLNEFAEQLISDFKIANTANSYDKVDFSFYLNNIAGFDISKVEKLKIYYKRRDYISWKTIDLQNTYTVKQNAANETTGYFYEFKKIKIERPVDAGYFDFFIKASVVNFQSQDSETISLYFNEISASQPSDTSSSFPEAEIIDSEKLASLRYEISARLSQVYFQYKGDYFNNPLTVPFASFFLNNKDSYKASSEMDQLMFQNNGNWYFYYDYQYEIKSSDTYGFVFPACVSEILPCIIVNELANQNQSIILFWKINDSFFDYKIFNKKISIFTSYIKAKIQYKVNNVYQDITEEITITKDQHFNVSDNKFILMLRRDADIIANKKTVFDSIQENDNQTDNLRILITEHKVDCSNFQYPTKTFVFNKLMIPDQWKYIAHDEYIPSSVKNSADSTIKLDFNSFYLRGIRLPDEGFKKFDIIDNILSNGAGGIGQYSVKIMYRVDCDFDVFYQDPIIEGSVNAVELPSIPSDVFVTPPDLVLPSPNYLKIENGGIQAEGIVTLDEYGKINGIQITNPGKGYSFYKTALSKRQQTFTDLIPYVKTSYLIVGTNQNNSPATLVIQNNSFDKTALLASIRGGVRLASVNNDKALLNNSSLSLSALQNEKIDQYFQREISDNAYIEDNSVEPYQVVTEEVEDLSIGVLDPEWQIISDLYVNKNVNPYEENIIYGEDVDAGVSQIEESPIKSNPVTSNEVTPITINPDAPQTSSSGGDWKMFELSGLRVIPDASAAVSLVNSSAGSPWMTLLPISVRSDQMYGFGPLPNMLPRAEMFNRFAMASNNLNTVRVIAPFVWILNQSSALDSYYKLITTENEYSIVNFETVGTRYSQSGPIDPTMLPINTSISVTSTRSVSKAYINRETAIERGLSSAGNYIVSTQLGESKTFSATIFPSMIGAIPKPILRNIKRKYLGIVQERVESCAVEVLPKNEAGVPYMRCSNLFGNFDRPMPSTSQLPSSEIQLETKYVFFNNENSISLQPRGTAKALQIFTSKESVCGGMCGDATYQTVDFSYTNMFPATITL